MGLDDLSEADLDYARNNTAGMTPALMSSYYGENPEILKWWKPEHDDVIRATVGTWQWHCYWHITDAIVKATPSEVMDAWKAVHSYVPNIWYNTLMYLARARAEQLRMVDAIRQPAQKICPLCERKFNEGALDNCLAERFGMDGLDYCGPCLYQRVTQQSGSRNSTPDEFTQYLRRLTDALQRVPSQNFGEGKADFHNVSREQRTRILQAMTKKPCTKRVKELFGNWLKALIAAELLPGDVRATERGIQCIAKDGHTCLSLGEQTIDDTLFALGLLHTKEPRYPVSNYRADFGVGNVFIEYYGLAGDAAYDLRCKEKRELAQREGIRVIELYPDDLASVELLRERLAALREAQWWAAVAAAPEN